MSPQAALEQAVVDAIIAQLGFTSAECGRTFDGRPPPACGERYIAVWSPCDRTSDSRSALDERYNVSVTGTVRLTRYPFDRWVEARDLLVETMMDPVRAMVHKDGWGHAIVKAANVLADRDNPGGPLATKNVGFCEALAFAGMDRWQLVSGAWFNSQDQKAAGAMQTASFNRARLVQAVLTAR